MLAIQLEGRLVLRTGAFWTPLAWLALDPDYAWSHAGFHGYEPAGDCIPRAVEDVASLRVAVSRAPAGSAARGCATSATRRPAL